MVSNPNMIVFGQIGRGKSAFVKTYLWRQAVFGRRAWRNARWRIDVERAIASSWLRCFLVIGSGGAPRMVSMVVRHPNEVISATDH